MKTAYVIALVSFFVSSAHAASQKPQSPLEKNIVSDLAQLPDGVFDAIFGPGAAKERKESLDYFRLTSVNDLAKSVKAPTEVYNPDSEKLQGDKSSSIVAINKDLFVEGFYRNMDWERNGYTKQDQPWLHWNAKTSQYEYQAAHAEVQLLVDLALYGKVYDAKSDLVTLYRGTDQRELSAWTAIHKSFASGDDTSARAQIQNQLSHIENGLFFSNDIKTAQAFSGDPAKAAVIKIQVPRTELAKLVTSGDIYVGFELDYFELSFLTLNALELYARGLTP